MIGGSSAVGDPPRQCYDGAVHRILAPIALLVIGIGAPQHSAAAPAAQADTAAALRAAFEAYEELRFNDALRLIEAALRQPSSREDLLRLYELQGLTHAFLGAWRRARLPFRHVLMLDPEHTLPDTVAPRFHEFLAETKARFASAGWLAAENATPPPRPQDDLAFFVLHITNDPLGLVSFVRFGYRREAAAQWNERELPSGPTTKIAIDDIPKGGSVDYAWTLLNEHGGQLAQIGTRVEPLRVSAAEPVTAATQSGGLHEDLSAEPPLWKRWWLWAVVGGVILAGATTVAAVALAPPARPACPAGVVCDSGF